MIDVLGLVLIFGPLAITLSIGVLIFTAPFLSQILDFATDGQHPNLFHEMHSRSYEDLYELKFFGYTIFKLEIMAMVAGVGLIGNMLAGLWALPYIVYIDTNNVDAYSNAYTNFMGQGLFYIGGAIGLLFISRNLFRIKAKVAKLAASLKGHMSDKEAHR